MPSCSLAIWLDLLPSIVMFSACLSGSSLPNGPSSTRQEPSWPYTMPMARQFPRKAWLQQGQCQLGFSVEDIEAFHREMVAKGVTCLQPPEEEDFGTLAEYADPDGLAFSVVEEPKKS